MTSISELLAESGWQVRGLSTTLSESKQPEDAKALLSEAFEELKKVELLDERDQARERAEESAREQADMDSIGLMRARLGAIA